MCIRDRIYTPILRQQIPEITDFFLPMEALSYKLAVISIDKAYPGQAKRAAMAFWSALPQFTYTKFVVVVDSHINVRDPRQVVWAIAAQVDPQRDLFTLENTPFDTLDFASEQLGLGDAWPLMPPPRWDPRKITSGVNPSAVRRIWNNGSATAGPNLVWRTSATTTPTPACSAMPSIA